MGCCICCMGSVADPSSDSEETVVTTGPSYRGVWEVVNKSGFTYKFADYQGPIFCVIDNEDRMIWTNNFELHAQFQNSIVERTTAGGLISRRDGVTLCSIRETSNRLELNCGGESRVELTRVDWSQLESYPPAMVSCGPPKSSLNLEDMEELVMFRLSGKDWKEWMSLIPPSMFNRVVFMAAREHYTLALSRLLNIKDYVHTPGALSSLAWRLQENTRRKLSLATPTLAQLDELIKKTPDASKLPYRDRLGRPPLMICANIGRVDLGQRLADSGIWSLDAQENQGWTALHCACFSQQVDFVKMLLKMGANPAARRNAGQTPYLDSVSTDATSVQALLQTGRVRWEDVPQFPAGSSVSADDLRNFAKLTGVAARELMSDQATDGSKLPHRADKLQLYDLLHTVDEKGKVFPIKGRASQLEGLLTALVHQLSVEKTSEFKPLMLYLLQSNVLNALDFDNGSTGESIEAFVATSMEGIKRLQSVLDTTHATLTILPILKYPVSRAVPQVDMRAQGWGEERISQARLHGEMPWISKSDYAAAYIELTKAGACASLIDFEFMIIHHHFWDVAYLYWLLGHAATIAPVFHNTMTKMFGDAYMRAPLKKIGRMHAKSQEDWEEAGSDPEMGRLAGTWLCDIVRGAVECETEAEARDVAQKIFTELNPVAVVRVKNTMHSNATTVGGYRDVKILIVMEVGASKQICEIQVLLKVFLQIKHLMHPLYKVVRGDSSNSSAASTDFFVPDRIQKA